MKLHYYPETDSLYVELKAGPGAETREVSAGINVDLNAQGNAVGFDIDQVLHEARSGYARDPSLARAVVQGGVSVLGSIPMPRGDPEEGRALSVTT